MSAYIIFGEVDLIRARDLDLESGHAQPPSAAVPKITAAVIAEGRYELVRAPDYAETRAWHVLAGGRPVGLVRPTWRGERSRPAWGPVDLSGLALPVKGTGRVTPVGNARTRDAVATSARTRAREIRALHAAGPGTTCERHGRVSFRPRWLSLPSAAELYGGL